MRRDGMGADREFTNIRVVVSKRKGLRVNREQSLGGGRNTRRTLDI